MKRKLIWVLLLVLLGAGGYAGYRYVDGRDFGPSDTPVVRANARNWLDEYAALTAAPFPTDVDLLLVGDSQVRNWLDANHGKSAWEAHLAPRKAAILGYGGDCTQHVLWRIAQGQMPPLKPRAIVVQIGTNNLGAKHDPEKTVAGIKAVVAKLREKVPDATITLMALFVREGVGSKLRGKVDATNAILAAQAPQWGVRYLDINNQLTDPAGNQRPGLFTDGLHLTNAGYEVWAKALEAALPTSPSER